MWLHIIDSIKFAVHAGSQNHVLYVTFNSTNETTAQSIGLQQHQNFLQQENHHWAENVPSVITQM